MKALFVAMALSVSVLASGASAQGVNLSGPWQCVALCLGPPGGIAYITQYRWDLNVLAGVPSRAWIDYPGHIWFQIGNQGAIYSPDGLMIQFDSGTVWQRDVTVLAPVVPVPSTVPVPPFVPGPPHSGQHARNARVTPAPVERAPAEINTFDGRWSVVIHTQVGSCGPEYRYGVQITNGNITTDSGESAGVSGRVLPSGAVSVSVSAGGANAVGQGRLSSTNGGGTWRRQSSGESCAGVWEAARRG